MANFKLNFMHLCDDAFLSQEGKLNLINIFEVINVVALPGSLLRAFLVVNLSVFDPKITKLDLDIRIKKTGTDKEVIKLPTLTPSITKTPEDTASKLGLTLQLVNINFQETGKYIVELQANQEVIGTLDFEVKLLQKKEEKN